MRLALNGLRVCGVCRYLIQFVQKVILLAYVSESLTILGYLSVMLVKLVL
jgi:hypothetical protein